MGKADLSAGEERDIVERVRGYSPKHCAPIDTVNGHLRIVHKERLASQPLVEMPPWARTIRTTSANALTLIDDRSRIEGLQQILVRKIKSACRKNAGSLKND